MAKLIIVESPTKAKTISQFLKDDYIVEASYGHVRDLPKKSLGIDIENNFKPKYVVFRKNQKRITALRKKAKMAEIVFFATDEDREGEAIAWHLEQILKLPPQRTKRIVFHEITKEAILNALKNPRQIDIHLVNAQQARRILDRLVGYKLSPFLWKKVAKGLSAGRVQSVAVRLIIEREEEIKNFVPQEYWTIEAEFLDKNSEKIKAILSQIDNQKLKKLDLKTKEEIEEIIDDLKKRKFQVLKIEKKETKKNPPPPFTTSTLQQMANNKFGFSAKQTMMIAQQLYEGLKIGKFGRIGLITYMRTDSLNLSDKFLKEAKKYIQDKFGEEYYPEKTRRYKTKRKGAQEAHEAIRPTNINFKPEEIKEYLDKNQFKLYQLIWQRTLASQMKEAIIENTIVDIESLPKKYIFRATGSIIKFDGFLKVYPTKTEEYILPSLEPLTPLILKNVLPQQHFTQPPPYYTEATLIKTLEEYGIGRPSTYAPIISTIQERKYIIKEGKLLKPTELGILVNRILVEHFPKIVDYQFTARLEEKLDMIANNKIDWVKVVRDFYQPFNKILEEKYKELSKKELTEEKETDEICPLCGHHLVIKMGRYGKFLACSNFPQCKFTKPIQKSLKIECPACHQGEIVEKKTKKGRIFYACSNYPKCKFALWQKPTGEKCPLCGSLLVYGPKGTIICSNKNCSYKKEDKEDKN